MTQSSQNPAPAPADPAPAPASEPTPANAEGAPQWDGDFDPERAARLVANLRAENKAHKDALAAAQAKIAEFETAQMSDREKLEQRAATAETELTKALRMLAVRDLGLDKELAQFITGTTAEEIEAQAKTLAARLAPATPEPPRKPTLAPVAGNGAETGDTSDPITREDLKRMTPDDIVAARKAGRLDHLLKRQ